jgi:hypothetical protein
MAGLPPIFSSRAGCAPVARQNRLFVGVGQFDDVIVRVDSHADTHHLDHTFHVRDRSSIDAGKELIRRKDDLST